MGPAGPFGLYLAPTPLFYATLLSFLPTYLPSFLRTFLLSLSLSSPSSRSNIKIWKRYTRPPRRILVFAGPLYSGGPRLKRLRRRFINSSSSRSPWRFFSEESRDRDRAKPNITLVSPFSYFASPFFRLSSAISLEGIESSREIDLARAFLLIGDDNSQVLESVQFLYPKILVRDFSFRLRAYVRISFF